MKEISLTCQVCGKVTKTESGLGLHISRSKKDHPTIKEYFDLYIKEEQDGICSLDGSENKTKFRNLVKGYGPYCSPKCMNNSPERKKAIKEGVRKKYGVDNVFQSKKIKEKTKQMYLEKYGVEHNSQLKEVVQKRRNTMLRRYGETHYLKTEEGMDRVRKTNLEKYGTEYVLQNEDIKAKADATVKEKYGVDNVFQNEDIKEKSRETIQEKYGVDNVSQNENIKNKKRETNLRRHGVQQPFQSEKIWNKVKQTWLSKHGFDNISKLGETKDKKKKTSLKNHGVEHPLQSEQVKSKMKQTNLERYGAVAPTQNEGVMAKMRENNLDKYGVEYVSQVEEFKQKKIETNLERYGCKVPTQNKEIMSKVIRTQHKKFFNELLNGNRLNDLCIPDFGLDDYKGIKCKYNWICKKCSNKFKDHLYNNLIPRCPICFPIYSSMSEIEVLEFVKSIYDGEIIPGDRSILKNRELDIYLPELKLAIEFNGLYWHSEGRGKDKNYHIDKTKRCAEKGIQLIHIFEDEWNYKQDIVKSILIAKMGLCKNRIYARKCEVHIVTNNNDIWEFYNDNHIQGPIHGNTTFSLKYENEYVAMMTIGKSRFHKEEIYEILRFCVKKDTIVVGGLSKLMKQVRLHQFGKVISYVDLRYGNGNGYELAGMKFVKYTQPNYFYVRNGDFIRESRIKYQKHKLEKQLEIFDPELTEWENMQLNDFDRVYDCGNKLYELVIEK